MSLIRPAASAEDFVRVREFMLASLKADQGYDYDPQWHWDLDHGLEVYGDNPRHLMLMALEDGQLVGTMGVRTGGPTAPTFPDEFVARYADREHICQVVRASTAVQFRRTGIARRLLDECIQHAAEQGFTTMYLHSNVHSPGAFGFWINAGARLVRDCGESFDDATHHTVHFEIPLRD